MTTIQWLQKTITNVGHRFISLNTPMFIFFSAPIVLLCVYDPLSFQVSWKGRVPYLMFFWLAILEAFLSSRDSPRPKITARSRQAKGFLLLGLVTLLVPTAFAMWQIAGGEAAVISLGHVVGAPYPELDWPIAFEATLFAACFIASTWLLQRLEGLRRFKVSLFFISAVAAFFMADTFYHQGTIWFLQMLVPPIASTATFFLNVLGYPTTTSAYADGYLLSIQGAGGQQMNLIIYWPCAGVHSMAIYTIVILLVFKGMTIPSTRKITYLLVGALGTFLANIARIVSIGIIGANTGPEASRLFHEYYGELFFVGWTVIYLAAVFLCESHHKKAVCQH